MVAQACLMPSFQFRLFSIFSILIHVWWGASCVPMCHLRGQNRDMFTTVWSHMSPTLWWYKATWKSPCLCVTNESGSQERALQGQKKTHESLRYWAADYTTGCVDISLTLQQPQRNMWYCSKKHFLFTPLNRFTIMLTVLTRANVSHYRSRHQIGVWRHCDTEVLRVVILMNEIFSDMQSGRSISLPHFPDIKTGFWFSCTWSITLTYTQTLSAEAK